MAAKIPVNATLSGVALQTSTVSKTGNYTLTTADYLVKFDCSSGALTATLPDATTCVGQEFLLWKSDGSANNLSINTSGSQNISSASTATSTFLAGQGDWLGLQSDGVGWLVVGHPGVVATVFTSSGTWLARIWTKFINVDLWGGGGAGASSSNGAFNLPGGGGGGGGGYNNAKFLVSYIGTSVTVSIPAKATPTGDANANGGAPTFGSFLKAYGGYQGQPGGAYGGTPFALGANSSANAGNGTDSYSVLGATGGGTNGGTSGAPGGNGGNASLAGAGGGAGMGEGNSSVSSGIGGKTLCGTGGTNSTGSVLAKAGGAGTTPNVLMPGGGGGGGGGRTDGLGFGGGNGGDCSGGGGAGAGYQPSGSSTNFGGYGGSAKCVVYENG